LADYFNLLFEIFILSFLPAIVLFAALTKFTHIFNHNNTLRIVFSLGIAPLFNALVFYYLLLLFPDKLRAFYISIYGLLILGISAYAFIKNPSLKHHFISLTKDYKIFFLLIVSILISALLSIHNELPHTNNLEYAILGKYFYQDMAVTYFSNRYDLESYFYYTHNSPFLYPLLLTVENTFIYFFNGFNELYFINIQMYYIIISGFMLLVYFKNDNPQKAILITLTFLITLLLNYEIFNLSPMSISIFLLCCSLMLLQSVIAFKSIKNFFALGACLGLLAFSHALGMLAAISLLIITSYNVVVYSDKKTRTLLSICGAFFFCGFIHYFLELFIGTNSFF